MADMNEVKSLIESQGRAWEEFKKTNDERLAKLEQSRATGDEQAKLAKIDADLNTLGKALDDVAKQVNRAALSGKSERTEDVEHKQAFDKFLRDGSTAGLRDIERKAMNSTDDTNGGYLVNRELDAAIDRVVPTVSALYNLARQVTIGTRSWQTRTQITGMTATWPGEGATSGETTEPTFARVEIVAGVIEVEPWVANETMEDADVDLSSLLADEAGISFGEGIGSALMTGTGVGKPLGLMATTPVTNGSYAWGAPGYIATGKAAAFASAAPGDKLIQLVHALKPQYRPGSAWIMADSTLSSLRQLKDGSGNYYLWQPDPAQGFGGRVLGYPVYVDDNVAAFASNALVAAFGNFQRAYAVVNRRGTSLIRDNVTGKGVTKFNFRRRIGGAPINWEAFKILKASAS